MKSTMLPDGVRARQCRTLLDDYRRRGTLWFSHAVLAFDGRYEAVEHILISQCSPITTRGRLLRSQDATEYSTWGTEVNSPG